MQKIVVALVKHLYALVLIPIYAVYNSVRSFIPYEQRAKSVANEIVLVTGAGSGIGKSVAKRFAKLGAVVVVWDVDKTGNELTAQEIVTAGGKAHAFQVDLCNREDIYRVAAEVKEKVGDVTILVNNAGIVSGKLFLELTDQAIERTYKVNAIAHAWTLKAFLPSMLEKNHGHIVTLASMAGIVGAAKLSDYCGSKFAAVGFHESIVEELGYLGKDGIKATLICPSGVNTGLFQGFKTKNIPMLKTEYVASKIIEAVLTNQHLLLMPRIMYLFAAFKHLLPYQVNLYLGELAQSRKMMEKFTGRKEN